MQDHDRKLVEDSRPFEGSYGCGAMLTETEIVIMVRVKASNYITIGAMESLWQSQAFEIGVACLQDWLVKMGLGKLPNRPLESGPDLEDTE